MGRIGKKVIGHNFLERHVGLHREKGLANDHVIVDRADWEDIVEFFHKNPAILDQVGKREEIYQKVRPKNAAEFIVQVGGEDCWLSESTEGDPPRTLIKDSARIFYSEIEARNAINRALETHPLTFRSYKIVPKKK